ncbi:hypothetical protein KFL_004850070 [Klebsormidium nitens]|uniref:Uncharacterized protein n=1 Tax=Klebsormidium nitens TaxID=105231 RepID=A0A1Y1IJZ5_KLENI|nr:hypothetical protein KFL_004850070 [Klebsormidium nitens]|eukprot:GAQ89076.1 hypothetical protein KFL_004850070 [Klebsormidium nitens]
MGKKEETFEAVLARMKVKGPLMMREQLKLLTVAAVEGVGEKVTRNELLAAAHMVSKEATKTAMAWSGEVDKEDGLLLLNVLLQAVSAFVTVCHGFTAGAGPTLLAAIRATATAVVEASAQLLEGCIDLFQRGATAEDRASALPKLAGRVWETCEAVKKAPTSNQVAVGRGLALLAATVKDTLREMGEMKETTSGQNGGESGKEGAQPERGEGGAMKEKTKGQSDREGARLEEGEKCATRSQGQADYHDKGGESASEREGLGGGMALEGRATTSSEASASKGGASGASLTGQSAVSNGQSRDATSVLGDGLKRMHLGDSAIRSSTSSSQTNGKAGSETPSRAGSGDPNVEEGKAGMSSDRGTKAGSSEDRNVSQGRGETTASQEGLRVGKARDGAEATASRENEASASFETLPRSEESQAGGIAEAPHTGGKTTEPQGGDQKTESNDRGALSLPDDLGDMAEILDYNPEFDAEDMELVRAAVLVAEGVLALLKQLLYVVAKWAPPPDWSKDAALNVLEMLHGDCSEICLQVEELGACLYPPQEIASLRKRTTVIEEKVNNVDDIIHEAVEGGASAGYEDAVASTLQACQDLHQLIVEGVGPDSEDE